jgi:hypothetical protein
VEREALAAPEEFDMKRFGVVLGVAMLCAPMLVASLSARRVDGVTGKWDVVEKITMKGGAAGPDGQSIDGKCVLDLKAKDDALTGTFIDEEQPPVAITDGKVNGNKITFSVKASDTDVTLTLRFALTLDGDHLKGEVKADKEIEGMTMTATIAAPQVTAARAHNFRLAYP